MRRRFFSNRFDYNKYLTIEVLDDGLYLSIKTRNIEYCVDGGQWVVLFAGHATPVLKKGQYISLKSKIYKSEIFGAIHISGKCNLFGNIMSLIYGDNTALEKSLDGYENVFASLFNNNVGIVNVSKDLLPATTLASRCYSFMFQDCTSLVNAPELPATTLASRCYQYMFYGCTSLVNAPELPATTLADSCYTSMFQYCTSLVNAPELPATTLADSCYQHMFYGCTSLVNAPELPATTLADSCYQHMFYGCSNLNYIKMLATDISALRCLYLWVAGVASSGTFVKNSAMTSLSTGSSDIPEGWTVENA